MLLLVLILVLIAFGLLVVALLSGSVLWAWVSVGVSVAAAAVLLIDWLQRRSALKAGAEAAAAPAAEPPRARTTPEMEPVTEVLPVVPRSGAGDDAGRSEQDAAGNRFDETADTTNTVVMPVVQPSASGERPSGASQVTTPSSGDSSPTVTRGGSTRSASTPSELPGEETSVAPASALGADAAPPTTDTAGAAPSTTATPSAAGVTAPGDGEGESRTTAAPVAGTAEPDGAPDGGAEQKADGEPGDAAGVPDAAGGEPASDAAPAEAPEPPAGDAAAAGAAAVADTTASGEAPGDAEFAPAATDEEPPEEPRAAAAAALVAGLETEVLVIDEQPRYHVNGCRALTGKALIPLPAREAVELGFTPCGWCTPDRTLAGQEAAAR